MTHTLKNRTIVVVGGGRGIGQAIALEVARTGANVIVAARTQSEIETTCKNILAEGGQATAVPCDVRNIHSVEALLEQTQAQYGAPYGLVCAVGVYGPIGRFEENPFEAWEKAIDINLLGAARCVHRFIPAMKDANEGRIILFSGGGQEPIPRFSSYVSSKGGIWRLTETLGAELAPFNILLNAIAPGAVNTNFLETLLAAGPEKVGKDLYKRSLEQKEKGGVPPDKAANLALHLLSPDLKNLYGRTLSAVWDNFENFENCIEISESDRYAFRRVIHPDGGTRPSN